MVISHKHKFVFIHSPKTAGTSIRKVFCYSPYFNKELIIGRWHNIRQEQYTKSPFISRDIWTHTTALAGKEFFKKNGWNWDSYFKFGFIRNPWDRMMSSYRYLIENIKNRKNPNPKNVEIYETFRDKPIKDFIMEKSVGDPTLKYLCDKNGNLMVDYLGKFETLQRDIKSIIARIDPNIEDCQWSLPHINKTKKTQHYSEFYDSESKEKVRSVCWKTIELGDYKFEVETN